MSEGRTALLGVRTVPVTPAMRETPPTARSQVLAATHRAPRA